MHLSWHLTWGRIRAVKMVSAAQFTYISSGCFHNHKSFLETLHKVFVTFCWGEAGAKFLLWHFVPYWEWEEWTLQVWKVIHKPSTAVQMIPLISAEADIEDIPGVALQQHMGSSEFCGAHAHKGPKHFFLVIQHTWMIGTERHSSLSKHIKTT